MFPGLPNLWDPLDVANLAKDWPRFRLSFEILIVAACNNELQDRQKLAIFLHCLGRNGMQLIVEWFPELANFNSPAAIEHNFGLLWNRMTAHCQSLPAMDIEESKEEKPKEESKEGAGNPKEEKPKDEEKKTGEHIDPTAIPKEKELPKEAEVIEKELAGLYDFNWHVNVSSSSLLYSFDRFDKCHRFSSLPEPCQD